MPYQPIKPHPYLESMDVDIESERVFSVILNPKDVIFTFRIEVFSANDSTLIFDTGFHNTNSLDFGMTDTDFPLYGTEEGTILSACIPDKIFTNDNGDKTFVNGDDYKWRITLTDSKGDSVTSPDYYFTTRSSPKIIFDVPDTITSCEYTFKASYTQEQGENFMSYKYSLYQNGVLVDETPTKIDSILSFKHNGFISGMMYCVVLEIISKDGKAYKISRWFNVLYETQFLPVLPTVKLIPHKNCVNVDYLQSLFVKGNTDDDISYSTYKDNFTGNDVMVANTPYDSHVCYHAVSENVPLNIKEDFTAYYSVHFGQGFLGTIISLSDEDTGVNYTVKYDGQRFLYKIGYSQWVEIDPYVDSNNIHLESTAVMDSLATLDDINFDTLYLIYPDDIIYDDSVILCNDITYNFWWTLVLLPNEVMAFRGQRYIPENMFESVVA